MLRRLSKRMVILIVSSMIGTVTSVAQVPVVPSSGTLVGGSPTHVPLPLGTLMPYESSSIPEVPVEKFRRSFYQGAEVLGGYYADTGSRLGGLNFGFQEARVSFGLPLGSMDNVLGFRPYFRATHLDGPEAIDVPETLYQTGVTMMNYRKWSPRLSTTLVASPEIRSDFTTGKGAFRIFGLAQVSWKWSNQLEWSVGTVFLDRQDVGWLPVLGMVWTPTPDFKVDGMIPRPRIMQRLWKAGGQAEGWVYLGGAFGGNSWAVTRASGQTDFLTLRDYRIMAGYEVVRTGNRGVSIEAGYSFGRTLQYESDSIERDLNDAVFVQANLKF